MPEPEPLAGDLAVDMRAASINPVDFKIRDGGVKVLVKDRFPLVLGCDLSGVVVKVGSGVADFAVGDHVFARLRKDRIGTFAERALVDATGTRSVSDECDRGSHHGAPSRPRSVDREEVSGCQRTR